MPTIDLEVLNASGLHARPATLFVETAASYQSRITVENLDRGSPPVDAKSILFLLTIGVLRGHRIRITGDGPDAGAALEALATLVREGLGEPAAG